MKVEHRQLPDTKVAYIRHFGEYGLNPTLKTLTRLHRWAQSRGLAESRFLGVPWNNPRFTPPEECCYDACVEVAMEFESDHPMVPVQVLPGGSYLVRICDCQEGDLETPWQEFLAWQDESEWVMTDDPCFEVYTNNSWQDASGNWSLELHMPVEPG